MGFLNQIFKSFWQTLYLHHYYCTMHNITFKMYDIYKIYRALKNINFDVTVDSGKNRFQEKKKSSEKVFLNTLFFPPPLC